MVKLHSWDSWDCLGSTFPGKLDLQQPITQESPASLPFTDLSTLQYMRPQRKADIESGSPPPPQLFQYSY